MRISTDSNSEFFDPGAFYYQPYLDGRKIKEAVELDTDEGWIVVRVTREDGSIKYPFEYVKLHGKVTVVKA